MKSRDHLIRLKRFQVEERRRRVVQIETMIAEFHRMAADLDRFDAALGRMLARQFPGPLLSVQHRVFALVAR